MAKKISSSKQKSTAKKVPKRITAKQRVARVKNIAVARSHRKKSGGSADKLTKKIKDVGKQINTQSKQFGGIIKKYGKKWDGIKTATKSDAKKLKSLQSSMKKLSNKKSGYQRELDSIVFKKVLKFHKSIKNS